MSYHQLTLEERYAILELRRLKWNVPSMAEYLGRAPSTLYRELKRNRRKDGSYIPSQADSYARTRRSRARKHSQFNASSWRIVVGLLKLYWSPEQISGRLRYLGLLDISHETIYTYVWMDRHCGGTLWKYLRQAGKKRRKQRGSSDSRGRKGGKRPIADRPEEAELREQLGHLEIDTVLGTHGNSTCIVTLVDRKSGYVLIGLLKDRSSGATAVRTIKLLDRCPFEVKTITADNGTEFHSYGQVETATGVEYYFARPYKSNDRASSENVNGLIRQYLPKGRSMAGLTQARCNSYTNSLNNRPRKRLGFRTPAEVVGETKKIALQI